VWQASTAAWKGNEPVLNLFLVIHVLTKTPEMPLLSLLEKLKNNPATERMPALFIGHGSPMNGIEDNAYSQS